MLHSEIFLSVVPLKFSSTKNISGASGSRRSETENPRDCTRSPAQSVGRVVVHLELDVPDVDEGADDLVHCEPHLPLSCVRPADQSERFCGASTKSNDRRNEQLKSVGFCSFKLYDPVQGNLSQVQFSIAAKSTL